MMGGLSAPWPPRCPHPSPLPPSGRGDVLLLYLGGIMPCCGDVGGWWFGWALNRNPLAAQVIVAGLTLGPPLNFPLGGGVGRWLAGEGTCCCGEGVAFAVMQGESVVLGGGTSAMGVVGAVREPPLRVGRRDLRQGGGCYHAVNLGHPPARCSCEIARVPLRGAKGGWLTRM